MTPSPVRDRLPKVVGADIELGNSLLGWPREGGSGAEASRLLLRNVQGIPGSRTVSSVQDPQDVGRKWLRNGSCCYVDLDHFEICLPEVTSAHDFTAALHAQLRIARGALQRASGVLAEGITIQALACNSDGSGASWGSHLNFLVTRRCFENIFHQRMHYLLWLASYQASSVLITGQGKIGAENGAPPVGYQLSQRADFFEEIVGFQTTYRRPIINSRDEPLCASNRRLARFHHIACDVNLCHVANLLKVGILQILLAMVEAEADQIRPGHILLDPVSAFIAFSHDPEMTTRQQTLGSDDLSALDLQRRFLNAAADFVARGGCDETVPHAHDIIALWANTLDCLAARDWETLSRRLDWVLKRRLLEEVLEENPELSWRSPEIKRLDLLYGSLDPEEGLYWALESAGWVDRVVTEREIQRFVREPPSDTRAYTRGHLLRVFGRAGILEANWDRLRVGVVERGYLWRTSAVTMEDPLRLTRAHTGGLFRQGRTISPDTVLRAIASCPEVDAVNAAATADWRRTAQSPHSAFAHDRQTQ